MKKILLVLCLLPLFVRGQSKQPLTVQLPAEIVTEQRLKQYGDSLVKALGGTVTPPVDPLLPCQKGPFLTKILSPSATGLTFQFDGEEVHGIEYWVRDASGKEIKGGHGIIEKITQNTLSITYPLQVPGTYQLSITGSTCKSKIFTQVFELYSSGGTDPPADVKEYPVNGTYRQKINGRTFGYNKTPEFALGFSVDGSITDVTPGLKDGKLDGRNVFYAIDNFPMEADGGGYAPLSAIVLEDGNYTIQQYVCDASKIPDFAAFKAGYAGWGDRGVNVDNARRSEIFLSIHSDKKRGGTLYPAWFHTSRVLLSPKHIVKKDWRPYYKFNGIGDRNLSDNPVTYHEAGIATYYGNGDTGNALWRTNRMPSYYQPTNEELYGWGRYEVELLGNSINVSTTSEFVENTYGQDKTRLETRLWNYSKGFADAMRDRLGVTDIRKIGSYGDYGGDDWFGAFGSGLTSGYDNYVKSLTSMLYGSYQPIDDKWYTDKALFYQYDIDYRNLNKKVYYDNSTRYVPYDLLYLNERIKLGTKQYEGKDRERNLILFTSPKIESFVFRPDGSRNNIEQSDTGEIIPYADGEILTKVNHQPPVATGEMFNGVLWSHLVAGGTMNWDAGGTFGGDSTLFDAWDGFEHAFFWKKKGEKEFSKYSPGQNGAPQKSNKGYINRLYAIPLDAHMAAAEVAWQYRDKTTKLSHVSYVSNRGGYEAKPGSKGLHLNGFGELNHEQYNAYHIYNSKKGISLLGEGPAGKVIIYYNGFLSGQLKETVTILGKTFTAQGRQTYILDI